MLHFLKIRQNLISIFILSFLFAFLALISGCEQTQPPSVQTEIPAACPDSQVEIDKLILSEFPFESEGTTESVTVFNSGIRQIYCTFWLTDDLCCTVITLQLKDNAQVLFEWKMNGNQIGFPQTVIMEFETGLGTGQYLLEIYMDKKMRVNFELVIV